MTHDASRSSCWEGLVHCWSFCYALHVPRTWRVNTRTMHTSTQTGLTVPVSCFCAVDTHARQSRVQLLSVIAEGRCAATLRTGMLGVESTSISKGGEVKAPWDSRRTAESIQIRSSIIGH